MIIDDSLNKELIADLNQDSPGCGEAIEKFYKSGKTLYSDHMARAAVPLSTYKSRDGRPNTQFYHYTNAKALLDLLHPEISNRELAQKRILEDGGYEKMFVHERTSPPQKDSFEQPFEQRVHYLAHDPISSQRYGKLEFKFVLEPTAKLLVLISDERHFSETDAFWNAVHDELKAKYPEIKDCVAANTDFMIAEASGVDLIDYSQLDEVPDPGPVDQLKDGRTDWFRLVRPDAIVKTEIIH